MLKVIIADDEARICQLVQMLADWDALDMEVIGTAANGLEALQKVEALLPDILITDIRMPGCDGLELIEKIRQISLQLEIIIISGYAQFEYARTAIRYGVGEYLLKPIKRDALMTALEKLGKRCRERADSVTTIENLRRGSSKSDDILRARFLEDLVHKRLASPTRKQLSEEYDFNVQDGQLQVFILKMDCIPEEFDSVSSVIVRKKEEEIFESAVLPLCFSGCVLFQRSAAWGVLNFDTQRRDDIRRVLRDCLNQLQAQKSFFGPVEFSLAIGRAVDNAVSLPDSMQEAQHALSERLLEGTGRLLESALPASRFQARQLLHKYNRNMENAIEALNADDMDKAADELQAAVRQVTDIRGHEIMELVLAAGKMFTMRIYMEDEAGLPRELEECCELCGSVDQLFNYLRRFQRRQIELMWELRENEAIRPIRLAKQYIQQHAGEPTTLEDVCAATGFSVSYFSTMFKKETGEGFSKYLTRVRIEKAKAMLQDTNLPVAEICQQVGYSDLKHFTGIFKKMTSISPGQYRKLYG